MLEIQNLCYSVDNEGSRKDIIKNVSLTLEDNKFYVITGPNGSGKSTMAKLIAGIEKPSSGKIIFDGTDITDMSITDRAKAGISFAFQQPVRFKGITVKDLINLAAGDEKLSTASACEFLSEVGLCARDYINREINASLSGGELKRIEIAVTLARSAKFSLFDEPEAGIDLWSFNNLIKVFEKLHDVTHGSIMIISHQEKIINIADEIILIANGELVKKGTKEEVLPLLTGTQSFSCKYTNE
ncbi:MAG: ATP-binding cassette domain-containing protein [Lachnospiraceae bacterium]|nr:ATP-binding cassette domain-containing protein [Lachnospiraceae bacterium]